LIQNNHVEQYLFLEMLAYTQGLEFVQANADKLSEIGYDAGIMADKSSMDSVARWGYANAVAGGSQGWIKSAQYEPIDVSYLKAWA